MADTGFTNCEEAGDRACGGRLSATPSDRGPLEDTEIAELLADVGRLKGALVSAVFSRPGLIAGLSAVRPEATGRACLCN